MKILKREVINLVIFFPLPPPFSLECGGELTSTYGIINSPGYPGNYPPNRDCYWNISTNPGLLITFAFGLLNLEHHDNLCTQDYLEVKII